MKRSFDKVLVSSLWPKMGTHTRFQCPLDTIPRNQCSREPVIETIS